MVAHTTGEWELRGNKIFVKGTYNSIAIVCIQKAWDNMARPIRDYEAEANQQLLCSAPKLLEALRHIKELGGFKSDGQIGKIINDAINLTKTNQQ